jgi:energy-coupling factor transporter ATP-binding protein EcfA2
MRATGNSPVLRATGLCKHFGKARWCARSTRLTRRSARETVAVTVPSGCGKSTLLHLLGGLERPTVCDGHGLDFVTVAGQTLIAAHSCLPGDADMAGSEAQYAHPCRSPRTVVEELEEGVDHYAVALKDPEGNEVDIN